MRVPSFGRLSRFLPWVGLAAAALLALYVLPRYPISTWDLKDYAGSPVTYAFMADQGTPLAPPVVSFSKIPAWGALLGLLAISGLASFSMALFNKGSQGVQRLSWKSYIVFIVFLVVGLVALFANDAITAWLTGLSSNLLFLFAVLAATLSGVAIGALMESTLFRPLYSRPIYQLMLSLGMSYIGLEIVRSIWGRPEFTMPKAELFSGSGEGCPATTFAAWWQNHCATILVLGGRVRVYNEILIPLVGLVVLISVWILLKRSRLGMIIRAGVQDRQMVEALGINVQRVFTQVFALGVGLAALGGALAAPSMGLSNVMGESLMINSLIALAIGGLTSYPGAAIGSIIVGMIQQFIIKYGSIGIAIPFTEIVFKPTPPLVPASTVLLMVIILLILPNGLLGKKE
jgi:branched-chain amino acid transport system permease protein